MAFNISKTDQVLVLLNRLAVFEAPSQPVAADYALLEHPSSSKGHEDEQALFDNPQNVDVEGQTSRRWSTGTKSANNRRHSQTKEPAAALRIVLGDQRTSNAGERKLRQAPCSQLLLK